MLVQHFVRRPENSKVLTLTILSSKEGLEKKKLVSANVAVRELLSQINNQPKGTESL